jgi:hypothetical protein
VVLVTTRPAVSTIDRVYVVPPSIRKLLIKTAYEPVRAGGGVGDGVDGVGVAVRVGVAVAVATGGVDEAGVGVGVPAAGCEQAANRSAMPMSSFFITGPTLPESIGYECRETAAARATNRPYRPAR